MFKSELLGRAAAGPGLEAAADLPRGLGRLTPPAVQEGSNVSVWYLGRLLGVL